MAIRLTDFKQVIPQAILTRGREYYRDGQVIDLNLEDEGVWSAQVAGTEVYNVQITQGDTGALLCTCTCPYAEENYCKHEAAVLYAIEETFPEYFGGKKTRAPGKKRNTRADKLQAALAHAPEADLRTLLTELASNDRIIYNKVLLQFGRPDKAGSDYTRMVKDALRLGRGQYGIIDYRGSAVAARQIGDLLTRADALLTQDRADDALLIYQAVADNVGEALPNADDSNGELYACIDDAINGIDRCAQQSSSTVKRSIFNYSLTEAKEVRFKGSDLRWSWLDLAADLVDSADDRETLFKALDEIDGPSPSTNARYKDFFSDYTHEQTATIRLAIITRLEGEAAGEAFVQANLHLRHFKNRMIERYLALGKLDQAKALTLSAIRESEKLGLPGLVSAYRDYLLTIAEREGDTKTVIQLSREAFLQDRDQTKYALLKKTVPAAEWPSFVNVLLQDVRRIPFLINVSAWIFYQEGMWDQLLTFIKSKNSALDEDYRVALEKRFPDDMAALYEAQCLKIIESASDRQTYQYAFTYLRWMKTLGYQARVNTIRIMLRERYAKRPALLDELSKV